MDEFFGMEITPEELHELQKSGTPFQLLDVREPYEFQTCNLGGIPMPIGDIPSRLDEIARDRKVILYCRSGSRSANAVRWLQQHAGFDHVYTLRGGIMAWAEQIDPSIVERIL